MLIDGLMYVLYAVLFIITAPLRLLPEASLSAGLQSQLADISTYISPLGMFAPLSTIFDIMLLYLGVETAIVVYKVVMWVIRRIPAQG